MIKNLMTIFLIATVIIACKKPYTPPAVAVNPNYLVVEGVLNMGGSGYDSTVITLSRTIGIAKGTKPNPLQGAAVTVEDDHSLSIPLIEKNNGRYVLLNSKFDTT